MHATAVHVVVSVQLVKGMAIVTYVAVTVMLILSLAAQSEIWTTYS